jgi:uncharacterized protein YndB with AHSA1/START domain
MVARNESEAAHMNQTSMELKGDREIVIERTFNGPPRIVFDAWTRPELVRRWWAPKSHRVSLVGCDADVRAGGSYRYVARLNAGGQFAFSGVYREVTPYSRLVYTENFEPTAAGAMAEGAAVVVTVTFEERDGKTHVVSHSLCPSKDVRDTIIASGMEHGMRESMDQLDELAATLAQSEGRVAK